MELFLEAFIVFTCMISLKKKKNLIITARRQLYVCVTSEKY